MTTPTPGSNDWLAQVIEPIEDPAREIIDPHHHRCLFTEQAIYHSFLRPF